MLHKSNLSDQELNKLNEVFSLVTAWNSLFHPSEDDQPQMFQVYNKHCQKNGVLLFTTGPKVGEAYSHNGGENLYHASLSPGKYKKLLDLHGFKL